MSKIQADQVVRQELSDRGITESTGVFGEHKVQIGKNSPIRLDKIKSASIPFAGFRTATKIARGKEGVQTSADNVLKSLASRSGTLDAAKLLGELKGLDRQVARLDKLGQLKDAQKEDGSWMFTAAVQKLSNRELSAVYQSFTTAEMDLLKTALMREGQINPEAQDARKAAVKLFDLEALVLKEISNRFANEQITQKAGDLQFDGVPNPVEEGVARPATLTQQFGSIGSVSSHHEAHDITAANLVSLTEVGARSATIREKSATSEQAKLKARGLDTVTVKEIGDTLRKADVTINIKTEYLINGANSIFAHKDDPMVNIYHLHDQGLDPKGPGYLDERTSTENVLFPELKDHKVDADERPMYGSLNVRGRQGGLSSGNGYGSSVIVLKPEAAKRATYIINDTFYAPRIDVSKERRQNFYNLLDGANDTEARQRFGEDIPQSLITALKDPNSAERRDFEMFLDQVAEIPEPNTRNFMLGVLPKSINAHFPSDGTKEGDAAMESRYATFKGFLTECFADPKATRDIMATHDNLESLVTQMDSVDGNNLAHAALENQNQPKAVLYGAQYIEAQIQGPLVPSRDIAEIRINLEDVPEDEQSAVRAQALKFEKDTGIKITIFETSPEDIDDNEDTRTDRAQTDFNLQHHDLALVAQHKESYLANLGEKVREYVEEHPNLTNGLPKGVLRLEGNALNKLGQKFEQALSSRMAKYPDTAESMVRIAFEEAVKPLLQQKAELLRELQTVELNDAQKTAVTNWVVSAKALRSPAELKVILKHAKAQADLFKSIIDAEPAPAPDEILRRMGEFTATMDRDLVEVIKTFNDADFGPDDTMTEQNRISFMSLSLLKNGEPPMDDATIQKLNDRLAGPQMRAMIGQIKAILQEDKLHASADFARLDVIHSQLFCNAMNLGNLVGHPYSEPDPFTGELSLLQEPLRTVLREVAPELSARLDELHPGYPSFPAPSNQAHMPQNEGDRRHFLVHVMDGYLNHEQTFEKGSSVHGRGHIARAYIFANVMCNILEEQGIHVDKNAVLCGIAGHDLGRQGGGDDRWEDRSANMTVEAMQSSFGSEAMGGEYEQEVKDSIDRHKGKTMEAMVLNAADSLDIGRVGIGAFEIDKFPFLAGKNGEVPDAGAIAIREQLAKEADLLQRLTNPLCANRRAIDKIQQQMGNASSTVESEMWYQQNRDLLDSVAAEFEADWSIPSDDYMKRFEDTVRNNPQMFPLLSKYYH